MPKYIFLDTNNWIYLSNGFNILSNKHDELHFKLFDFIKKHTANNNLVFLVNDIVFDEWERNKDSTENQIKNLINKLKSYNKNLNLIKPILNGEDDDTIEVLKGKVTIKLKSIITQHQEHVKEVEEFLKTKTKKIEILDSIKITAADMAVNKKAPFIGEKKNSMADALILFSSINYIKCNLGFELPSPDGMILSYPESYFVSSNKGDFSNPNNREEIHADLKPLLDETRTKYYYTFAQLTRSIEAEFLTKEEEEKLQFELDQHYTSCDFCDEVYDSVYISDPFMVTDENKVLVDNNQLEFSYDGAEVMKNLKVNLEDSQSELREAKCNYCSAEYIVCQCGQFTFVENYNEIFECKGECGNSFIANADIDRKGLIHSIDYEIRIKPVECQKCGRNDVPMFEKTELCVECENFYSYEN
jgi:hypothetical protein